VRKNVCSSNIAGIGCSATSRLTSEVLPGWRVSQLADSFTQRMLDGFIHVKEVVRLRSVDSKGNHQILRRLITYEEWKSMKLIKIYLYKFIYLLTVKVSKLFLGVGSCSDLAFSLPVTVKLYKTTLL
jgi:hypothetical protein